MKNYFLLIKDQVSIQNDYYLITVNILIFELFRNVK